MCENSIADGLVSDELGDRLSGVLVCENSIADGLVSDELGD